MKVSSSGLFLRSVVAYVCIALILAIGETTWIALKGRTNPIRCRVLIIVGFFAKPGLLLAPLWPLLALDSAPVEKGGSSAPFPRSRGS